MQSAAANSLELGLRSFLYRPDRTAKQLKYARNLTLLEVVCSMVKHFRWRLDGWYLDSEKRRSCSN